MPGSAVRRVLDESTGSVHLPPVSADRLAAEAASAVAGDPTISGTIRVHLDLGIPHSATADASSTARRSRRTSDS